MSSIMEQYLQDRVTGTYYDVEIQLRSEWEQLPEGEDASTLWRSWNKMLLRPEAELVLIVLKANIAIHAVRLVPIMLVRGNPEEAA